jgi:hypothetical protein
VKQAVLREVRGGIFEVHKLLYSACKIMADCGGLGTSKIPSQYHEVILEVHNLL